MQNNPLLKGSFGIFNHYLYGNKDWVKTTNELDIPALAKRISETGASRYCITLMQGNRYLLSPNATFDRIAGTRPGEACCLRDIPYELGKELEKYGIDLYLYYTGDGPLRDEEIGRKFGLVASEFPESDTAKWRVTPAFVQKWTAVLKEYAVRYGSLIKGWWIDGCYRGDSGLGYDDELLAPFHEACKAGNPDTMVALNNGCSEKDPVKNYVRDDYTCGEMNDFTIVPSAPTADGAFMHILAPLGTPPEGGSVWDTWCRPGIKRDAEYLTDFIRKLKQVSCALTIDIIVYKDGTFDPEQMKVLRQVSEALKDDEK